MINIKPLKERATKFPEPIRSILEMQKDSMREQEFVDFFIGLRKKAREIDAISKEAQK